MGNNVEDSNIIIQEAKKIHAVEIAELIMEAMNHECCENLAGRKNSLEEFRKMMIRLVLREDSQYSYNNTQIAVCTTNSIHIDDADLVGICVAYDGAQLRQLRQAFIEEAQKTFGIDHSSMEEETQSGELYIDSLCVRESFRGKGVASKLLTAAHQKAIKLKIPATGLLVDIENTNAERLYKRLGYTNQNDTTWASHQMKHYTKQTQI